MKRLPNLVQRCTNRGLIDPSLRLSQQLIYDYMGASEFEWGALPRSFRAIHADLSNYKVEEVVVSDPTTTRRVFVFHNLSTPESQELSKWLNLAYCDDRSSRTKEPMLFARRYREPPFSSATDLWHDISNHIMWSTNHDLVNAVPALLSNTVRYLDEQASRH
jgi:hypothetical protein